MRHPFLLAFLLAIATLTQAGCFLHAPRVAQTRRALEAQYPQAHFEKETALNLGPASLWMAGGLLRLSDYEAYARVRPYLRHLQRVEVGVYKTEGLPSPNALDPAALPFLRDARWRTAVRTQRQGEHVWVFYRREPREALHELFVFTLDGGESGGGELVALHLHGQIDRVVQHFLEEEDVLDGLLGREEAPPQTPGVPHSERVAGGE